MKCWDPEREKEHLKSSGEGRKRKREEADRVNVKNMGKGIQTVILCSWNFLKKKKKKKWHPQSRM